MRNDDLDKNMGGGQNKENYGGQQTPGRNKQDDDLKTGQRGAGQGQQSQHGKQGQGQENQGHIEDDFGTSGNKGEGQGGQNRGNF
ncbi:MAG: hypothetical protein LC794_10995 [Acidobacteria bacterium]|nr:hypothetical protein [Acidobacteriota bacterium]